MVDDYYMATKERVQSDLSKQDMQRLRQATEIAKTSTCKQQHGSVIVRGGSVLSVGVNRLRNDPVNADRLDDISVHAEVAAIKALGGNAQGAKIYVARWMKSKNNTSLSRPCNNCYKAIVAAGIKEIIYTD